VGVVRVWSRWGLIFYRDFSRLLLFYQNYEITKVISIQLKDAGKGHIVNV
jgi:hypothetical protein